MLLNPVPEMRTGELVVQTEKNLRSLEIEASLISAQTGLDS